MSKECVVCGTPNGERHHRVYRSQCKPLEHCKKNIVRLCPNCHRGKWGVHGKCGHKLDVKLKLEFQQWLGKIFCYGIYTLDEIQKKLDISKNAARSLSKLMDIDKGAYKKESIIRACMGGRLYSEEDLKDVI